MFGYFCGRCWGSDQRGENIGFPYWVGGDPTLVESELEVHQTQVIIQYLGIPFGVQVSLANQWRWIMGKFEKKLLVVLIFTQLLRSCFSFLMAQQ